MARIIRDEVDKAKAGAGGVLSLVAIVALEFILNNMTAIIAGVMGLVLSVILFKLISRRQPRVSVLFALLSGAALIFIEPSPTFFLGYSFACGMAALAAFIYGFIHWGEKERTPLLLSAALYGMLALPFLNVLTPVSEAKGVWQLATPLMEASVNRKMAALSDSYCPGQAMRHRWTPAQGGPSAYLEVWCGRADLNERIKSGTLTKYYPKGHASTRVKAEQGPVVYGEKVGVWTYWDRSGKKTHEKDYGESKSIPSDGIPTGMLIFLIALTLASFATGGRPTALAQEASPTHQRSPAPEKEKEAA